MKESLTRILGAASALLLIGLFVVALAPARADEVNLRIKALEQELVQLKEEQEEAKEASLAAAAKLPTFRYRPRGGLTISAADKSWAWRMRYRFHVHMYNEPDGDDARGRANGDLFYRRNRVDWNFYWENGFYEFRHGQDWDTGDIATQNVELKIHLEKLNPWLPTLYIQDAGGQSAWYVVRSSTTSAATEIGDGSILSDSAIDILSHRGLALGWINKKVGSGDFLFYLEYIPCSGCKRSTISDTDHGQFFLKAGTRPFRASKNKWLKKIKVGLAWKTDSIDTRSSRSDERLRIRSYNRRPNRITVFDTGTSIGDGQHNFLSYGAEWGVGPYLLRYTGQYVRFADEDQVRKGTTNLGGVSGSSWGLANELWLWSPKGFLTGSSSRGGSVQVGYRFMRADADCGNLADCVPGSSTSSGNHIRANDVSMWYYIRHGLRVGIWWNHFSTPNMPTNQQQEIGCSGSTNTRVGKECSWWSWNLGLTADW